MRASVDASLDRSYPRFSARTRQSSPATCARWRHNDPYGFASINRMLGSINLNPEGDKVKCPTLVIGGIHDAVCPPRDREGSGGFDPGSEYVEAETGHFMAVQTPGLFLELALPFLRG